MLVNMVVVTDIIKGVILSFAEDLNFCEIQYFLYCRINEGHFLCFGRFVPTNQYRCQKLNYRITKI